ncbi:hypothetical protein NDU88_005091 [Pleurodeles waltl]|uniref:Uncharacterized protein n=1 Tax=Pleurodeles waltl TaxID=8319 RepID=A0AAV7MZG6_PLEWA|nr:hypothetical protein NDU88_005091 [Pleurodeles waltl]
MKGRYLLLQRVLDGKEVTFFNVYVPIMDNSHFFDCLLEDSVAAPMIWEGDYNCVFHGALDRYSPKHGTEPLMTSSLDSDEQLGIQGQLVRTSP